MRIWNLFEAGSGIWDGKNSDSRSGINIPDPQHWNQKHTIYTHEAHYFVFTYDILTFSAYFLIDLRNLFKLLPSGAHYKGGVRSFNILMHNRRNNRETQPIAK
jgi:hypothetical protein